MICRIAATVMNFLVNSITYSIFNLYINYVWCCIRSHFQISKALIPLFGSLICLTTYWILHVFYFPNLGIKYVIINEIFLFYFLTLCKNAILLWIRRFDMLTVYTVQVSNIYVWHGCIFCWVGRRCAPPSESFLYILWNSHILSFWFHQFIYLMINSN